MSDLVRTLAFAFRRKGADALRGTELRLVIAFDLNWLAPEDAKRAVTRAIEAGLLREEGEMLRPTFDPRAIDVPLNFRPGPGLFDEPVPADLPPPAAEAAEAAAPQPDAPAPTAPAAAAAPVQAAPAHAAPPEDRSAQEERARRGNLVTLEVARLVVARRAGEDVREQARALAERVLKEA